MAPPSAQGRLVDLGKRLSVSLPKDALIKLLKQAVSCLSELSQSPEHGKFLKQINEALVQSGFLHHKDKDVRLLVSACFNEIVRILAPDAPFSDEVLKDIFKLFVNTFKELNEIESSYFARRAHILQTIAKVRCCIVMLDIDCNELIQEMFQVFFSVAREDHPSNVLQDMSTIMETILEESGDISQSLLDVILNSLVKNNKNENLAAYRLAVSVIQHCAVKLTPYVQHFLISTMVEKNAAGNSLKDDFHDIIFEIYQCAPEMLIAVIPNLMQGLLTDSVDVRLKAVHLLGRMFALPEQCLAPEYRNLFAEFIKRFSDKAVEVRLAVVECAKECFLTNSSGSEGSRIISGLKERLLDFDEKVRVHAVNVICSIAKINLKFVPVEVIKDVSERLRDKRVVVRKETLHNLIDVYKEYCIKSREGLITRSEQFEWIPGKILRLFYDKDCKEFRLPGMELVLTEDLFPSQLSVDEKVEHWILMFSFFSSKDVSVLEYIFSQKQRLQKDMQMYLSLRQKLKEEDTEELRNKIQTLLKMISTSFLDPSKAVDSFQKLHQMKDNNIFKALSQLLDPETTFKNSLAICEDLLNRIGKRHPQYDFLRVLSLRCSYILFGKEHVKAVFQKTLFYKSASDQNLLAAATDLLMKILKFFPFLVKGSEEEIYLLLEEHNGTLREKAVEITARAGSYIKTDKLEHIVYKLKALCQNGGHKEGKHAVFALAALTSESGQDALSLLYKELLIAIESNENLPTVLQSLGSIAQAAISIFEDHEDEVISFIVKKLFKRPCVGDSISETASDNPCNICQKKIYGLKTLVRTFLPYKEGHKRKMIARFLEMLEKLIQNADFCEKMMSSIPDKAHFRLAAAKSVLRLARRWESRISPTLFHHTVLEIQDPVNFVRRRFLQKINKHLRSHTIGIRYASAFAFAALDDDKYIQETSKKYLADFVVACHREAQLSQATAANEKFERSTLTKYPEYVLVYVIHILGHLPNFPGSDVENPEAYGAFCRPLCIYLQALLQHNPDDHSRKDGIDNLTMILSILRALKKAKDAVNDKSNNIHILSDIAILVAKELGSNKLLPGHIPGGIPLPSNFYKECEGESIDKTDGSSLPSCLREGEALKRLIYGSVMTVQAQDSVSNEKRQRKTPEAEASINGFDSSSERCTKLIDLAGCSEKQTKPLLGISKRKKTSFPSQNSNSVSQLDSVVETDSFEPNNERKKVRQKRKSTSPKVKKTSLSNGFDFMGMQSDEHLAEHDSDENGSLRDLEDTVSIEGVKNKEGDNKRCRTKDKRGYNDNNHTHKKKKAKTSKISQRSNLQNGAENTINKSEEDALLIGKRIRVWWPVEKRYYCGLIDDFDSGTKIHKISYDDGETELLHLPNERWELIDNSCEGISELPSKGRRMKQKNISNYLKSETIRLLSQESKDVKDESVEVARKPPNKVREKISQSSTAAVVNPENVSNNTQLQHKKQLLRKKKSSSSAEVSTDNKQPEKRRKRRRKMHW